MRGYITYNIGFYSLLFTYVSDNILMIPTYLSHIFFEKVSGDPIMGLHFSGLFRRVAYH